VTELSGNAEGDVTSRARCAIRFGDASGASKARLIPCRNTAKAQRSITPCEANFPRAAKFLDLGAKASSLPEERKLVEKAQLTIARR
jgi:hypothetical protein